MSGAGQKTEMRLT